MSHPGDGRAGRHVPLISFTAYIPSNGAEQALAAGCNDDLAKPVIDPDLIREKVLRLLAKNGTA